MTMNERFNVVRGVGGGRTERIDAGFVDNGGGGVLAGTREHKAASIIHDLRTKCSGKKEHDDEPNNNSTEDHPKTMDQATTDA